MKKEYRIFFAIPFDSVLTETYEHISDNIEKLYKKKGIALTTKIGTREVGPNPRYSKIVTFKAQNRLLMEQFRVEIQQADIVVADLTYNNPNVHVELGIAITHNKNILRVTGRSITELGFDIKGLEVHIYKDKKDLEERILEYLTTFFMIKNLSLSSEHGNLYWKEQNRKLWPKKQTGRNYRWICEKICPNDYMIRDGAVRVKFRTVKEHNPRDNWFGVYFRTSPQFFKEHGLSGGSYLLFVRSSGRIELAIYPGPRIMGFKETHQKTEVARTLSFEFENNQMNVKFSGKSYPIKGQEGLERQIPGSIHMAAWNADINVNFIEMIWRDTIDWS